MNTKLVIFPNRTALVHVNTFLCTETLAEYLYVCCLLHLHGIDECVYSFAFTFHCYVVHMVTFISVIKGSFAMKFALFNC